MNTHLSVYLCIWGCGRISHIKGELIVEKTYAYSKARPACGQQLETISVFGDNLIHSNGIKVATMGSLRGLFSQIRGVKTVGTS